MQNDIKRVVAYSTCSQLGYMFVGLGVGAYSAGIFHLFTHAFFKALLFLGAGSVIIAMHHEQDIRNMGGLAPLHPVHGGDDGDRHARAHRLPASPPATSPRTRSSRRPTPRTAAGAAYAFLCTVIAAFMTSFYSWRLYFLTFEGAPRWGAPRARRP